MTLAVVCSVFLTLHVASVWAQPQFHCNGSVQTIDGVTDGVIVTRQEGNQFYSNNLLCEWIINAGAGKLIQLVVEELDLQWSPEYATCTGYDNLQVLDGPTAKSPVLTVLCHARNPFSIISKGEHLHLIFTSDSQNFYNERGITVRFRTFNNGSCPPDWFQVAPSSPDCLLLGHTNSADWANSQDVCNINRANLASILSELELNAILEHGQNVSQTLKYAWIGLNDLQNSDRWIDRQTVSFKREIVGKRDNTNCIAQDFTTGTWHAFQCDTAQHYICKAKKDGNTVLYQAEPPSDPPEEEEGSSKAYIIVICVIVGVVFACVVAVTFYCLYWRRRAATRKRSDKRHEAIADGQGASIMLNPLERRTSQPSAPPADVMLYDPQHVAPPSYEESQHHPVSPSTY